MTRPRARRRSGALLALALSALLAGGCAGFDPRPGLQRAALAEAPAAGSDAEAVFAEAYRLEQRAAFGQALQYYNVVIDRFPGSPLVGIARERVTGLAGQQAVGVTEPAALLPGDFACTVDGLYPNQARWCGVVRQMRAPYFQVEVTDVRLNSWFALWFSRSTCTGDAMLSWFSQGQRVWVPRSCLAEPRRS